MTSLSKYLLQFRLENIYFKYEQLSMKQLHVCDNQYYSTDADNSKIH